MKSNHGIGQYFILSVPWLLGAGDLSVWVTICEKSSAVLGGANSSCETPGSHHKAEGCDLGHWSPSLVWKYEPVVQLWAIRWRGKWTGNSWHVCVSVCLSEGKTLNRQSWSPAQLQSLIRTVSCQSPVSLLTWTVVVLSGVLSRREMTMGVTHA